MSEGADPEGSCQTVVYVKTVVAADLVVAPSPLVWPHNGFFKEEEECYGSATQYSVSQRHPEYANEERKKTDGFRRDTVSARP